MKRFRLLAARRHGERIALEEGFTSFPIDPFAIADANEIIVEAKDPGAKGVSGGIIFNDAGAGIFYATDITNEGFQRFTVAHELGHYFLEGHPEEILATAPIHMSRAGFTEGTSSIELEADHFASGLLLPTRLVRQALGASQVGLRGILDLADAACCSITASAIRAAECSEYPMAVIVSCGPDVRYAFLSEAFKRLDKLRFLRKDSPLPPGHTKAFNADSENVARGKTACRQTSLAAWFSCMRSLDLDEEIVGLGKSGLTLTVLSSDVLAAHDDDGAEHEEAELIQSWTPRHAYGR
jgi:hypothetical protein